MTNENTQPNPQSPNAVDDARRVRERLSADFGGDIRQLAEYAQRLAEQRQASLRLKVVQTSIPAK